MKNIKWTAFFRRLLVVGLSLTLMIGLLPTWAMASVSETKGNSAEKNQQILASLKELCGSNAEAQTVMDEMIHLGVLDQDGNLVTSEVTVDGKKLTLDEVRKLVNAPDTDLTKRVTVDGTALTLENLKTIIQIEDELQKIQDKYFSGGVTLTAAQRASLKSFYQQLETQGVRLYGDAAPSVETPSGVDHTISAKIDISTLTCDNGSGTQSVTVALTDKDGTDLAAAPDYAISIPYRFVNCSAVSGTNYTDTSGFGGKLTFSAGGPAEKAITFSIKNDTSRFQGQKTFLLQFYDPENVYLNDHMLAAEKEIVIQGSYTWSKPDVTYNCPLARTIFSVQYSGPYFTYGRTESCYTVPSDVVNVMKDEGIFNTIDFSASIATGDGDTYSGVKAYATIGYDDQAITGYPYSDADYQSVQMDMGTIGRASSLTTKKTFGPDSGFVFQPAKLFNTIIGAKGPGGSFYISSSNADIGDYIKDGFSIRFYDTVAPFVKSVAAPAGETFQYGQSVPITVTFSEPVDLTNVTMTLAGGRKLSPLESGSKGVRQATFLYPVAETENSAGNIEITSIDGGTDLSGIAQTAYAPEGGFTLSGVIRTLPRYYSFSKDATVTAGTDQSGSTIETVTLPVADNSPTTWIDGSQIDNSDGKNRIKSVYASIDGGTTKIPLYCVEDSTSHALTGLSGTFTPKLNMTADSVNRAVEFYYTDDSPDSAGAVYRLMPGKYATYTVAPVVYLESGDLTISDNFPEDCTVFAQDGTALQLTYSVSKSDATWKSAGDFAWSSSDESIATIDSTGKISLTGTKEGDVTFTLTAENGKVEGKAVTKDSRTLHVKVGLTPFLTIPDGVNQIFLQEEHGAEVRWTSNLIAKYAEKNQDAVFTVTTYRAVYKDGVAQKGDQIDQRTAKGNSDSPVASCVIPATVLTGISVGCQCSYLVEVSAADPYDGSRTLTATAYIWIASQPAVVHLGKPGNYFLTDSTSELPITWTLQNFDTANGAQFELQITKNSGGGSVEKTVKKTGNTEGSDTFSIPAVADGLKDSYTVAAKAKNSSDSTWSYDSFVFYVYSDSALKLWVDGAESEENLTMSNVEKISKMTSEEILALNRDINLKNVISINYGDYAWGQISDQIKWASSNNSVADINYKDVNLYSDIQDLGYTSYRPTDTFVLSGLKDGQTTITATHAATGKSVSLDVTVQTLKDKLYLFQISPRAETTLTYTNGKGEQRTVKTNDNGELALYEESGIASEINMKSSYGDDVYMGTLYDGLVSSEKDSTKLQLYPVNYFQLRKVATAELYFKNPDGTAFSKDVILRGGVYKNGVYCPDAKLNETDGKTGQIIHIDSDGKFTVQMDASQFWTKASSETLLPSDQLDFIFEVRFSDDAYYPRLLDINCSTGTADAIRFGTKAVRVEPVPEGGKGQPFIVTQDMDCGYQNGVTFDVRNDTGSIGPGQSAPDVKLITTVMWWGEDVGSDNSKHRLTLQDAYQITPSGQTSESLVYPFSTIKATRNTFTMDSETMDGWLKSGESRGMTLLETDAEGAQYQTVALPFTVTNMLGVEKVEDSKEINNFYDSIGDNMTADASGLSGEIDDPVISNGVIFLCNMCIDKVDTSEMFNVVLSPTADPTVYSALIYVNLGNMSNDNVTGIYTQNNITDDVDYLPSVMDVVAMEKGNYLSKQKETYQKNRSQKKSSSGKVSYTFGGSIQGELKHKDGKWAFYVLNGGFNAGGGYSKNWEYNTSVGGIPVTGEFTVGGTAEVIFKAAVLRGDDIKTTYNEDSINDYLTTLRLYAYLRAFGGLGFDYSVAALKIGAYGQISLDSKNEFLNRFKQKLKTGQVLSMDGKTGIEFVAKFLFVSYEKDLASIHFNLAGKKYNDWDEIYDDWADIIRQSESCLSDTDLKDSSLALSDDEVLVPVSDSTQIESRDYLNAFPRIWNAPGASARSLLRAVAAASTGVKTLQSNAYPYSAPVLTKDGQLLLFLSDGGSTNVEDTHVCWSQSSGGGYSGPYALETSPTGYGDSQLGVAGNSGFAAATWVQQSSSLKKEAGDAVTDADIALMSNSTEVMAAVYNGSGWTTTRLTDNATPDLAPVVATNGRYVLVAWRSVYAADASKPLDFSVSDTILYRIYDKDTNQWSDPQTLYNGTSGNVKGLEAAMLSDGTAGVAYTIAADDGDSSESATGNNLETVYAVVGKNGDVVKNVRLTNDDYPDENPQITTATFGDNTERFVLGWFSQQSAEDGVPTDDIRLCAFDSSGTLDDNFIESIGSVNANTAVDIGSNFRFVNNAKKIDDLSILWTQTADMGEDASETSAHDLLKAVRFRSAADGKIFVSAPLTLAEMPDDTLINSFGAYNGENDTVLAVLLDTDYSGDSPESNLCTASGTFQNTVGISYVGADPSSIIRGMTIPVQFSLYNAGIDPIDQIQIDLGGKKATFSDLGLLPNGSVTLTAYYDIPQDRLTDPDYTVTAYFSGSDKTDTETGKLYLDIPDVGISKLEQISDVGGKRVMQVTLYNDSDSVLADSGRSVKLGLYTDADCTQLAENVVGQESGTVFTVDSGDLALVDAGAYTHQFTFDIQKHVGDGNEIPDGGVRLYAKAWIEQTADEGTDTVSEYNETNNVESILFASRLNLYNTPVSISTVQTNEGGGTNATVTLRNNSLVTTQTGNLVVSLLDEGGNILETQQSYDKSKENSGLITLGCEGAATATFRFDRQGASLAVSYSNTVPDGASNNTNLASLSLSGVPIQFENGQTEYIGEANQATQTLVSATAEDPSASVEVNGSQTDLGNILMPLSSGLNQIDVTVTAADGETTQDYLVKVYNSVPAPTPPPTPTPTPTPTPSSGSGTGGASGQASFCSKAVDGTATLGISDSEIQQLIQSASQRSGSQISITPTITGKANEVNFKLSGTSIARLQTAGLELNLGTASLNLLVGSSALSALGAMGANSVTFAVGSTDSGYEISVLTDGKEAAELPGLTALVPVSGGTGGTVAVLERDDGTEETNRLSFMENGVLYVPLSGRSAFSVRDGSRNFTDTNGSWAEDSIQFVAARGLFQGNSNNQFNPNGSMTRGMLVTVLGRLSGADVSQYGSDSFPDIKADAYYAKYAAWASKEGIVKGFEDGGFGGEAPVTREQLAVILTNFLNSMGFKLKGQNLQDAAFSDQDQIGDYAKNGVNALYRAGVLSGKKGNLFDPKGTATRAQISAMLNRLIAEIQW